MRDSPAYQRAKANLRRLNAEADKAKRPPPPGEDAEYRSRVAALHLAARSGFLPESVEDDGSAPTTAGGFALLRPAREYRQAEQACRSLKALFGDLYVYTDAARPHLAVINSLAAWWHSYAARCEMTLVPGPEDAPPEPGKETDAESIRETQTLPAPA